MIRTNNPALKPSTFGAATADFSPVSVDSAVPGAMTLQGAVNKTFILLALCAATALFAWSKIIPAGAVVNGTLVPEAMGSFMPWLLIGGGGGFVVAMITIFNPKRAPILAPIYALLEGLFVGAISAVFAIKMGAMKIGPATLDYSIIMQAGLLTFGILAALLIAYSTRLIKPTENFKLGIAAATGGIMLLFLAQIVLSLFGASIPMIFSTGPIGIAFAGFIVVIASLNLVLDFDFIEEGVATGAPKHMEWYAGFGLLMTLIWLYVSILRLLYLLAASRE